MTFTDAAREVLRKCGRPLHYKEITELAIEQNLLSHVGKSPEVTMGARLAATLKKGGDENPLVRVKPGVFALREWDDDTIRQGLEIKRAARKRDDEDDTELGDQDDVAIELYQAEEVSDDSNGAEELNHDDGPRGSDEELRAEIAAGANDVFAEEDDDDQPILRSTDDDGPGEQGDGRRRRRRRRRRGSRSTTQGEGDGQMPTYTTTPAFDGDAGLPRGPQVIELSPGEVPVMDGLAGRSLADAVAIILSSFDRTVGAVSLRQITETAQRRGKLSGDGQLAQSQIAAAVRADNALRTTHGYRPRFRMVGGRVGLTEWLLDNELLRLERDVGQALNRFREAARRAFVKKCAELPAHAFVELCVTVLERVGVSALHQVKFPGASGAEAHLAGILHVPAGTLPGAVGSGEGLKLAVVIRKDGRDLGRERVTELRGTAHHYDNAAMGWILTTGQVLSGAREESAAAGVLPVTLLDGQAIARLSAEHDVAVVRASNPIAIPDVDFFEALRAS
jgi:hypothetical protein